MTAMGFSRDHNTLFLPEVILNINKYLKRLTKIAL